MQIRKTVIPAAGFGTRMLPATKAIPKELVPVVDRPAIQHVVEEAVASCILRLWRAASTVMYEPVSRQE